MRTPNRLTGALALVLLALPALAGCGSDEGDAGSSSTVTLVTHDSWNMSDDVIDAFEAESGYRLRVVRNGDAGLLTNKLVLTKDDPLGDVVFGIDNTFGSRAIAEGVLAPYRPVLLPSSVTGFFLPGDTSGELTPVDYGDVCVNVDDTWFAKKGLTPPRTLDDLVKPAYRDLLVVPGATSSSPGLAFLLATIGAYGEDGWKDYWRRLLANGVKIDAGWTDAYEVDFSGAGGGGDRPLVISYSSSPPFTVPDGGNEPTTSALLDTCFRQVEYAGVLAGAKNPEGAEKLVDFLAGSRFQAALPDNMYVYPVDSTQKLPAGWDTWAPTAPKPLTVDPATIDARRADWLRDWRDLTTR